MTFITAYYDIFEIIHLHLQYKSYSALNQLNLHLK